MNNWFLYLIGGLLAFYLVFLVRYWVIRKRLERGEWQPGLHIDRVRMVFFAMLVMFAIGLAFFARSIYKAVPRPEPTRIAVSPDIQPSPVATPVIVSTPIEQHPITTPVSNETENNTDETWIVIMLVLGFIAASPIMDWILKAIFSLTDEEYAAGARGLPYGRRRNNDRS